MTQFIKRLWLLISVLWVSISMSAYDVEVDGFYYNVNLDDFTATIVKGDYNYKGEISIPLKFVYKNRHFSVVKIGKEAFAECEELKNIVIPDAIISIGDKAFFSCTALKNIHLPNALQDLGNAVFQNCTNLEAINIPSQIEILGNNLFAGCSSMKEITIPANIKLIRENVFADSGIEECTIEDSENVIELQASDINLGYADKKFHVSVGAFSNMPLKKLYLGRNYNLRTSYYKSNKSPFFGIETLEEIVIGSNVSSLPAQTFVSYYSVRTNTTSGYDWEYKACPNLTKLTVLPGNEKLIFKKEIEYGHDNSDGWFDDYKNIINLHLERNIDYSEFWIFNSIFPNVEKAVLDIGCTEVNNCLFDKCSSLHTVELSESIIKIYASAFYGTKNLNEILIKNPNPPTFEGNPGFTDKQFMNVILNIPISSKEKYSTAEIWKNFWEIKESAQSSIVDIICGPDELFNVYDLSGVLINRNINIDALESLPRGIYIVKSKEKFFKIKI